MSDFRSGPLRLPSEPKKIKALSIDLVYTRPDRYHKVFHLFDSKGGEIVLNKREAVTIAEAILREAGKK